MTDTRKLLERCARVARYRKKRDSDDGDIVVWIDDAPVIWNPTKYVADAAELAIKCKVDVLWVDAGNGQGMAVNAFQGIKQKHTAYVKDHPTEQAAYCYAICSVVAQIGGE